MTKPIIKWAGGKYALAPTITPYLPESDLFVEPFCGGAGLSCYVQPSNLLLVDINPELMNLYCVVRDYVEELIATMHYQWQEVTYGDEPYRSYYLQQRELESSDPLTRAARFLYLNANGFNGLWRVNLQGKCNVPWGKYDPPRFRSPSELRAFSQLLQSATLICGHYTSVESTLRNYQSPFVYLDPPYLPVKKGSFTGYSAGGFTEENHRELAAFCRRLDSQGVKWMMSNSNHPLVWELYSGYNILMVRNNRSISCRSEDRGVVKEVLISNYEWR